MLYCIHCFKPKSVKSVANLLGKRKNVYVTVDNDHNRVFADTELGWEELRSTVGSDFIVGCIDNESIIRQHSNPDKAEELF